MASVEFTVKNNGPRNSPNTRVVFDGLQDLHITSVNCSIGTFEYPFWRIGDVPVDAVASIEIMGDVIEGRKGASVTAVVSGGVADHVLSNNTAEITIGGEEDDGAPCEIKLNIYDETQYAKFSIRTVDFDNALVEEYYDEWEDRTWVSYFVFMRDIHGDIPNIGEFVGGDPVDAEWWDAAIVVDVSYSGDGTQMDNNCMLWVDFTPYDGNPVTSVRKPSDPLNHTRYGRRNIFYAETLEQVQDFINDLARQPLCVTLTADYNSPPIITSDMREATHINQIELDLRTPFRFGDPEILVSDDARLMDILSKYDPNLVGATMASKIIFAYTKEDGVLVGEMETPIEDIDYLFITAPWVDGDSWRGEWAAALKWDALNYHTDESMSIVPIPTLTTSQLVDDYFELGLTNMNHPIVHGNSEYLISLSSRFGGSEAGPGYPPPGEHGLVLSNYWHGP